MELKKYNLQTRKAAAVFFHAVFLVVALIGISLMYLNSNFGKGLSWLGNESYEDTDVFSNQVQRDIDKIFTYVNYRDIFETNGTIDMSKPMVRINLGPDGSKTYSLDEIIRIAKSKGYYLNDKYQITGQPVSMEEENEVPVEWRAYLPDQQYSEPGEGYLTMEDLALEVLTYLGDYYATRSVFFDKPTNLTFQIVYEDKSGQKKKVYSNNMENLGLEQLKALGDYVYLSGETILMDSNMAVQPRNVSPQLEAFNPYDSGRYYMVVAVDTSYPQEDSYAKEAEHYQKMRTNYIVGMILLVIGIIACLVTLYYLILVSGYSDLTSRSIHLHKFDELTTEMEILLFVIGTWFAIFLGEKVGYRMLHTVLHEDSWHYGEQLLHMLVIYAGFMVGAFSMLRRYKARTLYSNSLLHRIHRGFTIYFTYHSFTVRLTTYFAGYLLFNVALIGAMVFFMFHWDTLFIRLMFSLLAVLWSCWNLWTFYKLYLNALEQDKIGEAIQNISSGDTSFKIDTTGFSGKEKELADSINNIGSGMEAALQEQVKSERLKADLITNVSHDIKTPLTSIINYVDLIKRERIQDEKIQGYLEVLDQKSQRLKTLTEDLVEASKASSGNLKLDMGNIDLVELIQQTTGEFEEKFALRHLEIVTEIPDEIIIIEADGRRLWRVLENLFNNAFKYSMERSRVYVSVAQTETHASFTIKNVSESPLNINPDELSERFVRGDVSRTTEGSGLGLSIAKSLTELQNGEFQITIDGDLFKATVEFPLTKPAS